MADDATTGTVEHSTTTTAATETQTYVNTDGTFKDGWATALVPEDLQGLGVYKTVTNVGDALKQLGHLEKLRGKQGKGVFVPAEDATPTERELFYKAMGRPDTPEGYAFDIPKEMEAAYSKESVQAARQAAHEAGLTPKQFAAIMDFDRKRYESAAQQHVADAASAVEAAEKALRARWGAAYDERLHIANRIVAENVPEADKAAVLAAIGNNPVVADFLATVGKKFMEDGTVRPGAAVTGALTPAEIRGKITELEATPGFIITNAVTGTSLRQTNPAQYQRLIRDRDALYDQLRGSTR